MAGASVVALALRLLVGGGLMGFGAWGLQQVAVMMARGADSLLWILQLFLHGFLALAAVLPIVLGAVVIWRPPVFRCDFCGIQYVRTWLGSWQSRY